jgi:hypothetical protein
MHTLHPLMAIYRCRSNSIYPGIRAAQQVPHLHFHIVPRPSVPTTGRWAAAQASYAMFGRGQRDDLDEAEGEELAGVLREAMAREVRRVREKEGVDLGENRGRGREKL